MYRVELSKRALRDLRRIDHKSRKRLLDLLEDYLAAEPQPANLDIKALTGRVPWLRLRRGEHRAARDLDARRAIFARGAAGLLRQHPKSVSPIGDADARGRRPSTARSAPEAVNLRRRR